MHISFNTALEGNGHFGSKDAVRLNSAFSTAPRNIGGFSERFGENIAPTHPSTPKNKEPKLAYPKAPKQKFELDLDDIDAPEFLPIEMKRIPFQPCGSESFLQRTSLARSKSPTFEIKDNLPENILLPDLDFDDE